MTLNITLLVQVVHFLLAYFFLKRWLFAPLFVHIQQEDAVRDAQEAELASHEQKIHAARQEKVAELHECARYFSTNKPIVAEQPPAVEHVPEVPVVELSSAEQNKLKEDLVAAITNRAQQ